MSEMYNLWHGCHRKSEGCLHCYVFRRDAEFDKDSNKVAKTSAFGLPLRKNRQGEWKVPSGTLMWTCFTSDFFIEEGDAWREEAWTMMRRRNDLHFYIVTKRPERIAECLPDDWGEGTASGCSDSKAENLGYPNVTICCTVENQRRTDERLPIFRYLPLPHKALICEPLLEDIDFRGMLGPWCEQVSVGGESGREARVCDYDWVLHIRQQCIDSCVPFFFKQTGALFRKDGRDYRIPRRQQMPQARKAGIAVGTKNISGQK